MKKLLILIVCFLCVALTVNAAHTWWYAAKKRGPVLKTMFRKMQAAFKKAKVEYPDNREMMMAIDYTWCAGHMKTPEYKARRKIAEKTKSSMKVTYGQSTIWLADIEKAVKDKPELKAECAKITDDTLKALAKIDKVLKKKYANQFDPKLTQFVLKINQLMKDKK